ncbi:MULTISPECIES: hypothetical protein [Pseudomonas aeruginosa group]|uniref:Secreted protein n=4 Tax=Pseudomonadota TaxID=1224 RepID=A0ABD7JT73_PSEAI|nr:MULTISPECIES: hypothetical protein [Pseudomonas aeruginosa group]KFF33100.1 hypothetical protein G039_0322430 [Pseudomonas aeruginosa VRFPA01]ABR85420.1 hypothetical protein PSPA7_5388 [Pseudomonas aeruginosa PA7]AVK08355.1 hypothetical protein CSB93_0218 [Pseudomonas paraeruginosa]AWE93399.1 hypothetical protein CSC28_5533 [Pseudomonas paraeruginosa]KAB0751141.1 hypothetical protein F7O94_04330 [Pseudomonas aeruginosa]
MSRAYLLAALLAAPFAHAEMTALDDEQLSDVQGAGIGFVLDNAMLDGNKATVAINGVTNTSTGQNVPITVKELYLAATGSDKGSALAPVTLGRLNFPFKLNLAKGSVLTTQLDDGRLVSTLPDNADVIELAFPSLVNGAGGQPCIAGYAGAGSNCSSRAGEKVDAGIRFDFGVTSTRTDVLNLDFSELAMDGSYLRFWGANARSQLVGEMRLNLYAKTFEIMSCGAGSPSCVSAAEQAARTVYLTNAYASVALGYGKSQPLLFSVTADGNFTFELPKLTLANAADFYANAPRTSLVIENLNIGGTRPGYGQVPTGGYDMGRNEISGLSFNYLKVTSHNL